jgi:hypothetical protein
MHTLNSSLGWLLLHLVSMDEILYDIVVLQVDGTGRKDVQIDLTVPDGDTS